MNTFITVEPKGLDEIVALWHRAPELTERELYRGMQESTLLAEFNIKLETPKGVSGGGGLVGSISAGLPQKVPGGLVGFVGTSASYAAAVENDTRPHFPPIQALESWVAEKINPEPEEGVDVVNKVATLIALKIAKHGTKGKFMFKKGIEKSQGEFEKIFDETVIRIRSALVP
jgi:hypothetical protein